MQFTIKGYSDKQHVLLQKLMDKMMTLEIDEKRFAILLERVSCICFITIYFLRYFTVVKYVILCMLPLDDCGWVESHIQN